MKTADELIQEAKARSGALDARKLPGLDALRLEAKAIFSALPEPPAYRRDNDPAAQMAQKLVAPAIDCLARLYCVGAAAARVTTIAEQAAQGTAASGREGGEALGGLKKAIAGLKQGRATAGGLDQESMASLNALTRAMELHLRALVAMGEGRIVEADLLASEAMAAARQAMCEGVLFRFVGMGGTPPVFDRATGVSRYDPRSDERLKVQLTCLATRCRKRSQYEVAAQKAFHRLACPKCGQSFGALIGRVGTIRRTNHGVTSHYAIGFELLGEPARLLEFDDASQKGIPAAAGDLVALLYSCTGSLAAAENLTSGALHLIVPKGACFVATMAFGEGAPELDDFRAFRDARLVPHPLGRRFVRAYYRHGGSLARLLSRTKPTRRATRWALEAIHARLVRGGQRARQGRDGGRDV